MIIAALVAHEGGWDEILLVAGPIVVIVGLLAMVKRRVDAQADGLTPEADRTSRPVPRDPGHAP